MADGGHESALAVQEDSRTDRLLRVFEESVALRPFARETAATSETCISPLFRKLRCGCFQTSRQIDKEKARMTK
jgi:hypothetical protein